MKRNKNRLGRILIKLGIVFGGILLMAAGCAETYYSFPIDPSVQINGGALTQRLWQDSIKPGDQVTVSQLLGNEAEGATFISSSNKQWYLKVFQSGIEGLVLTTQNNDCTDGTSIECTLPRKASPTITFGFTIPPDVSPDVTEVKITMILFQADAWRSTRDLTFVLDHGVRLQVEYEGTLVEQGENIAIGVGFHTFVIKNVSDTPAILYLGDLGFLVPPDPAIRLDAAGLRATQVSQGRETFFIVECAATGPGTYSGRPRFYSNDITNRLFRFNVVCEVNQVTNNEGGGLQPAGDPGGNGGSGITSFTPEPQPPTDEPPPPSVGTEEPCPDNDC